MHLNFEMHQNRRTDPTVELSLGTEGWFELTRDCLAIFNIIISRESSIMFHRNRDETDPPCGHPDPPCGHPNPDSN